MYRAYHSVKCVKRSALDCFTVVACEKRAAVGEFRAMEYVKRGALDCFMVVACEKGAAVGAYHGMGYEKRGAFEACLWVGYAKRTALDCFMVVGYEKCTAFSCPHVGAYCIRPTNVPPKEGEGPAFGRGQAFAIYGMAFCGAYAIRPYPDGRKMIAVGVCYWVGYEKRGAMPAFYCLTWRRSYACDLLL